MTEPRHWEIEAGASDPSRPPIVYGDPFYVSLHGMHHVYTGKIVEDEEGDLRGWIATDAPPDQPPIMIHHKQIFPICFPYGVQAEVDAGHGEVINLRWDPDPL